MSFGSARITKEKVMFVTTLDVMGLTAEEYRAVLDEMGVEQHPDAHIFLHIATPIEGGYRIVELWDNKDAFNDFLTKRLLPANEKLGLKRATTVTVTPLHNLFAPRLRELPGVVSSLPGARHPVTR
jgi:hypothetical protein